MLTPAIPTFLAVAIWFLLRYFGYETRTVDGLLFLAAIAATVWLLFRRKKSFNDKANQ